jgi:heme exporter protein B
LSFQQISALVKKEFILEFRQKASLSGILLYLLGCVYLCYLVIRKISVLPEWRLKEKEEWNALLWILLLFNAIIAASKSFSSETRGRALYNFSIYNPRHLITAKLIYNMLLVLLVSLAGYFFFSIFIGNPVKNLPLFIVNVTLSSMAFSGVLTMTAGIASKTNGSFTLMSVLSIPLLFPMLLLAMRVSLFATLGKSFSYCSYYLLGLLALNVIICLLCILLFPYLWRD